MVAVFRRWKLKRSVLIPKFGKQLGRPIPLKTVPKNVLNNFFVYDMQFIGLMQNICNISKSRNITCIALILNSVNGFFEVGFERRRKNLKITDWKFKFRSI